VTFLFLFHFLSRTTGRGKGGGRRSDDHLALNLREGGREVRAFLLREKRGTSMREQNEGEGFGPHPYTSLATEEKGEGGGSTAACSRGGPTCVFAEGKRREGNRHETEKRGVISSPLFNEGEGKKREGRKVSLFVTAEKKRRLSSNSQSPLEMKVKRRKHLKERKGRRRFPSCRRGGDAERLDLGVPGKEQKRETNAFSPPFFQLPLGSFPGRKLHFHPTEKRRREEEGEASTR